MSVVIISFACIAPLVGYVIYKDHKKRMKKNAVLEESLEDDSIFVPGVGKVSFEELGEAAHTDPDSLITHYRNPLYEEGNDPAAFRGSIKDVPLSEERRLSIDDAFLYLQELLGRHLVKGKDMLLPDDEQFPKEIGSLQEIVPLARHIARIMDIDPEQLEIGFFEAGIRQHNKDTGNMDYWAKEDYAGLYHGVNEAGKYLVTISDDIHRETDRLIATIAHEFAHIKLLGENRMSENSEELTDMLPLLYGFGIFAANSAFKFDKHSSGWQSSSLGYLGQADWGYAMALYLHVRNETAPEWLSYMNKTVAGYCRRSLEFIRENGDKVLKPMS